MKDLLAVCFPDIEVRSLTKVERSWEYEVWTLNESEIVRYASSKEKKARLEVEMESLRLLGDQLPLPIPQYYAYDKTAGIGLYRKIPGEELNLVEFREWGADLKKRVSKSIGKFLTALHAVDLEPFAHLRPKPEANVEAAVAQVTGKMKDLLEKELSPEDLERICEYARMLIANKPKFEVLRHGDFCARNLLVHKHHASGVIDFSQLAIGDPAVEFSSIPFAFRQDILEHYTPPQEDPGILLRSGFYSNRHALFGILSTAPGKDDWESSVIELKRTFLPETLEADEKPTVRRDDMEDLVMDV